MENELPISQMKKRNKKKNLKILHSSVCDVHRSELKRCSGLLKWNMMFLSAVISED